MAKDSRSVSSRNMVESAPKLWNDFLRELRAMTHSEGDISFSGSVSSSGSSSLSSSSLDSPRSNVDKQKHSNLSQNLKTFYSTDRSGAKIWKVHPRNVFFSVLIQLSLDQWQSFKNLFVADTKGNQPIRDFHIFWNNFASNFLVRT